MSDTSGDEFASYNTTTPAASKRKASTHSVQASGRTASGSSSSKPSTTAPKKNGNKRKRTNEQIVISLEDEAEAMDEDDVVIVPPPGRAPAKKPAQRAEVAASSKSNPKRKGKARAEPSGPSIANHSVHRSDDTVDAEDIQELEDDQVAEAPAKRVARERSETKPPPKPTASASRQAREHEKLLRELDNLRRRLDTVKTERDKYAKQLEDDFHIRRTEAEELLEQKSAQYEAQLKTQENLISELTTQLAKAKAQGSSGKSQLAEFLIREAADAKQEAVKREVGQWKDLAKQKDELISQKDKDIAALKEEEKLLKTQLAAEIERAKSLANTRQPPSTVVRTHTKPTDDPKNALVIRLYEDSTNLLITSAKIEKSKYLNLDTPVYTCIYTHKALDPDIEGASLNFTLREVWETPEDWDSAVPVSSKDDLLHKVQYNPRDLQNEPPEFVEALDFFREPFVFSRDQLPVFLKTLTEKLNGIADNEEDEQKEEPEVITIDD
ncbi:hypothetical protein WOLCODRAFT_114105 [Wolfiporia cocos MD-104 SS10]|uniref:Monopolin complex subunit Csm1/Pcs1 C-terminal domain-containing protein n=1 Tax=Wolfiporia cocos (strain MD-104) TaxID=742152 RepID=A0A2H3J801_WOLCO|nr:hypothetical protein WOLCODRAFT_114105 [Wolfiporia cocos MD-104 SS10]